MVGILCDSRKERVIARYFHKLTQAYDGNEAAAVIVFSLSNVNLFEKTVYGSLVSEKGIISIKTSLPLLIFNLAVQHKRSDMKKLRSLSEYDGMFLVNAANKYNQWSIMDMLLSGNKTRNYILPYTKYDKDDLCFDFSGIDKFILKPVKRSSLSGIIYGRQSNFGFDIYSIYGTQCYHRLDIQNAINPIIKGREYLLLKTPELITYRNNLLVIRVYIQKMFDGRWKILSKTSIPQDEDVNDVLSKKTDTSSLHIANYVNCFIPDLGICFIDFVLDMHGEAYFINLGGLDSDLITRKRNTEVFAALCKNILEYAENISYAKPDINSL